MRSVPARKECVIYHARQLFNFYYFTRHPTRKGATIKINKFYKVVAVSEDADIPDVRGLGAQPLTLDHPTTRTLGTPRKLLTRIEQCVETDSPALPDRTDMTPVATLHISA